MTCAIPTSVIKFPHNDWLMYVLYHDDVGFMGQIVESGCRALKSAHPHPRLGALIDTFMVQPRDSVNVVRVKMLVMLELVSACVSLALCVCFGSDFADADAGRTSRRASTCATSSPTTCASASPCAP